MPIESWVSRRLGLLDALAASAQDRLKSLHLMEERYRKRATIITTNLDYSEWVNFLGNKALVSARLSRLRHQRHTIKIDGPRSATATVAADPR